MITHCACVRAAYWESMDSCDRISLTISTVVPGVTGGVVPSYGKAGTEGSQ